MNIKTTVKTALVIEKDNAVFEKIEATLLRKEFLIERATSFAEALIKLEAKEYQRVICDFKLTDTESFEFIGKVKQLPYNHPNLVLRTATLLGDQEKIAKFDELVHSAKMRKELGKIFEAPFEELDVEKAFPSGPNYLEFSQKNKLPSDKTYIYDFYPNEILLGAWVAVDIAGLGGELIINACLKGAPEEIVLSGKYEEVDPFDTNKGEVAYLTFHLDQKAQETWKSYLDRYAEENVELEDLLINIRGY